MSLIWDLWRAYTVDKMKAAFEIAISQYGIREWSGNNHNPDVLKYFSDSGFATKDDETSWCSAFVCWCVQQAGMVHTKSLTARSWLNWGEAVWEPRVGDITVLWRVDPKGWQGHVGFFVRQNGSRIWLLGGNQSNEVNISDYDGTQLLGYRRNKN